MEGMPRKLRFLFVALLLAVSGSPLAAQDGAGRSDAGFELEQNYPNPFNPETRIPFTLGENLFQTEQPVRVTIRVYNMLSQLVASPTALRHPEGDGTPVVNLEYTQPGRHEAFWDGRDRAGVQVASGVYFYQIVVNGQSQIKRMLVAK